jgi:hypothetical protein
VFRRCNKVTGVSRAAIISKGADEWSGQDRWRSVKVLYVRSFVPCCVADMVPVRAMMVSRHSRSHTRSSRRADKLWEHTIKRMCLSNSVQLATIHERRDPER